ncbi:polysaccharide deacetylase family protein [bacterium]|nr:polysaccharide deacetylase family protein [bacterium]
MTHRFALTVDVEEWFMVENLRPACPISSWPNLESRVVPATERVLAILREEGVGRATFFVVGQVAERYPDLVKRIAGEGFEIASHSMDHISNFEHDEERVRWNLAESKRVLERIAGAEIAGYRAPSFSIDDRVVRIARECGYRYDASYNDTSGHDRYGRADFSAFDRIAPGILRDADGFTELGVANLPFAGKRVGWGGGGYFRLIPGPIYNAGMHRVLDAFGHAVFYCHPWEFDPAQPRVSGISAGARFRHYNNLAKMEPRLRALIRDLKLRGVEFVTAGELAEAAG